MALIIVLSVFNGFDNLIKSVFSSFDPDLLITINEGKVFEPTAPELEKIKTLLFVEMVCPTLEENVLLEYEKRMAPAVIKGVPQEFTQMSGVDTMMYEGQFVLNDGTHNFAVIGSGIAYYLSVGITFLSPIEIYVPKRSGKVILNPANAFNKDYIFPSGVFSIQQEIDSKYILAPIDFARQLLEYPTEVTALEIKLKPGSELDQAQETITNLVGTTYSVKNRYQQHEVLYQVMKSEKFIIYLILTFILIIASFNIIGSLAMLIIDKKNDIMTLRSLGLEKERLQKIFLFEGWMISLGGAFIGLVLGAIVCWIQQQFGLLKLSNMGTFLIDDYPIQMQAADFILVLVTVVTIGLLASWYPVKYFTKRYLQNL